MKRISSWLISCTAQFLKNPKFVILLPLLLVLLVAYDALYELTLRPINSHLLFHYTNFTLRDGHNLLTQLDRCQVTYVPEIPSTYKVMKIVFSGQNTLRYDFLQDVLQFEESLPKTITYISPLTILPMEFHREDLSSEDYDKIDRYVLRVLNHDCGPPLVKFYFNDVTKTNHLIKSAKKLYLYVFYDPSKPSVVSLLPKTDLISEIKYLTDPNIAAEFIKYYRFISGKREYLLFAINAIKVVQFFMVLLFVVFIYLCIANSHKIRSNLGLVIGWVISVLISSLTAVGVMNFFRSALFWPDVVGATNWVSTGFFVLLVMLLSSRNLSRTINDLAGDSTFGASENIHKRLIKFYLGINSSEVNSQGVYFLNRAVRKRLLVDWFAILILPIPNTSVILLINVVGLTLCFAVLVAFSGLALKENPWHLYFVGALHSYSTFLTALFVDHFLQLTFIVGIVIIDLNRVDLTDLIKRTKSLLDDLSHFQEYNYISATLFGCKGQIVSKDSWRYRLGIFFLKISFASLRTFWVILVPSTLLMIFVVIGVVAVLVIPSGLSPDLIELLNFNSTKLVDQTYNFLYRSELFAAISFVIAISELTFVLTYSKRQRRLQDYSTTLILSSTELTVSDLLTNEKMRMFESITLNNAAKSDILKLNSNTKCSLLVSTDLERNVLVWQPSKATESQLPLRISTEFSLQDMSTKGQEFWPINHIELSDNSCFIILINFRRCRLKCYNRRDNKFAWEVSLINELNLNKKRMNAVATFYRKKTVVGVLARKLLLKKKKSSIRRGSNASVISLQLSGNYSPPQIGDASGEQSIVSGTNQDDADRDLHRDDFCMILETGELITISCDSLKVQVHNILTQLYEEDGSLKIISLKLLQTARVNDRVICNLSNDDIVVGTAVNNVWRFNKLDLNVNFNAHAQVVYAPSLIKRTGLTNSEENQVSMGAHKREERSSNRSFEISRKYSTINKSYIVTIDFVGMFVRVQDLRAELIDVLTGTILKRFLIGSFKPGSFRVAHSEPSHCKFCGCASVESISLIYEDFYHKTLIVHSYTIETKRSRNNICLRVERDPREVRCLGFDSVVEHQFCYENVEKWELTDLNVIMGIEMVDELAFEDEEKNPVFNFENASPGGLSTLKSRKNQLKPKSQRNKKKPKIKDLWQGFVITVLNGKLYRYSIPSEDDGDYDYCCTRPNYILKYGYKAIAIAFGSMIKILYLGGDHLIENDLYYSGTTSSLNQILRPGMDEETKNNSLLFISKRRNIMEQRRVGRTPDGSMA